MTTATQSLADFLMARIAEDEADAFQLARDLTRWQHEREVNGPDGSQGSIAVATLLGSASDPARVLAECDAKRAVIDAIVNVPIWPDERSALAGERALLLMAAVYADHPGYRSEWKP